MANEQTRLKTQASHDQPLLRFPIPTLDLPRTTRNKPANGEGARARAPGAAGRDGDVEADAEALADGEVDGESLEHVAEQLHQELDAHVVRELPAAEQSIAARYNMRDGICKYLKSEKNKSKKLKKNGWGRGRDHPRPMAMVRSPARMRVACVTRASSRSVRT